MSKLGEYVRKKVLTSNIATVCLWICVILLFLYSNVIINKLKLPTIDLTKERLYTLSQESRDVIKYVDQEIYINIFGFYSNSSLINLLNKYNEENRNIIVQEIDVIERPDLAEGYGITSSDDVIIIQYGEKIKYITSSDLYSRDFLTLEVYDVTEQKITNSIMELLLNESPTIYILTGHSEYSGEEYQFIVKLENELNTLKPLDLITYEEIPNDCDLILITTPREDIKDFEADKIIDYIYKGGKILYFQDYLENTEYPNLQKILNLYGVSFEQGIVIEQDADRMYFGDSRFIIPNLDFANDIVTKIATTNGRLMLINSGAINVATEEKQEELNITVETFMASSNKAFLRKDQSIEDYTRQEGEKEGPFILGTRVTKEIDELNPENVSTLVVVANNMFITDATINFGNSKLTASNLYNNLDFGLNAVANLTKREDTITIRKNTGSVTYMPTGTQNTIVLLVIFIVPALIILCAKVVQAKRKDELKNNKKN